ncbi:L-serine ammonia-lyase, iron-sulfur-dependent, subunit alpha [Treponema sp. HNW]|uniref:L-cysteine desulfidase family protein n=1 Tax=Treponema sp. HNW TaxID=3116654 RepID=UPI003D12798F
MSLSKDKYETYVHILQEELVPALGCTEPISLAFAAAKAAETLAAIPDRVIVEASGNIIKNVKSVIVPNSKGLKGIEAAAAMGIFAADSSRKLEVLSGIQPEQIKKARNFLMRNPIEVYLLKTPAKLHFTIEVFSGTDSAFVEIMHQHTDIVKIVKNGTVLFDKPAQPENSLSGLTDRTCLNVEDIFTFAQTVQLNDIRKIIERQIEYNTRIAQEGLRSSYGANVGANLLKYYGNDIKTRARAAAAAGSDARMSGCVFPVVINSGSGNQGIAVSLPVIEYARFLKADNEKLIRALVFSNLLAIHQKTAIGRLSAYCGAVSAACGSGAGITYLCGGSYEQICKTITNTLANVSGIICDGAKPSCAAKIASAVDAAIMAHCLSFESTSFQTGDGIIKSDIEKTIGCVGKLAADGMVKTDETILDIMGYTAETKK